jgi:DNA-nicking Smr family endonuclease
MARRLPHIWTGKRRDDIDRTMGRNDREEFLDAIAGTVPLPGEERDRVRVQPDASGRRRREVPAPVALQVEGDGVVISARAPGVNRVELGELRRGRVRPEETLDLHGHTAAQAAPALTRFLLEAQAHRRRCVLVVHGRGMHSGGVAVLRDLVIDSLVGPLSGLVHAFATAARSDGGAGATYVMPRSG